MNTNLGWTEGDITSVGCMVIEAWGTSILALVIFALTDTRNAAIVRKEMVD